MQTILITGGTGLIGKTLVPFLTSRDYQVIILTREKEEREPLLNVTYALWDIKKQQIDIAAVQKADYIIHLAGAGVVAHKWTKEYKKTIVESRTQSSALLVKALRENKNEVKAIVSSSAIGWYGADKLSNKAFTEDDPPANDFLGETCKLWEDSISEAESLNIRVCKIRTGIVLDKNGGALQEFIKPIKLGMAAILGSGKQMISWIHVEDHCRIMLQAIEHSKMSGSYNSVAPGPVTNKQLVLQAAEILKGKFFLTMHVPNFVLKIMMGQRSTEILKSTTVSCTKIKETGFTFIYPTIKPALENLLN